MTPLTGFVVYALTWWVVIFAVLPLGIKPPAEKVPGEMPGAPADPQMKKKIILTTIISAAIWLMIYGLIKSDLISFREMAQGM